MSDKSDIIGDSSKVTPSALSRSLFQCAPDHVVLCHFETLTPQELIEYIQIIENADIGLSFQVNPILLTDEMMDVISRTSPNISLILNYPTLSTLMNQNLYPDQKITDIFTSIQRAFDAVTLELRLPRSKQSAETTLFIFSLLGILDVHKLRSTTLLAPAFVRLVRTMKGVSSNLIPDCTTCLASPAQCNSQTLMPNDKLYRCYEAAVRDRL